MNPTVTTCRLPVQISYFQKNEIKKDNVLLRNNTTLLKKNDNSIEWRNCFLSLGTFVEDLYFKKKMQINSRAS